MGCTKLKNMKKNVTYLLGAGASASANEMPVVKEMNNAIFSVISLLEHYKHSMNFNAKEVLQVGDLKLTTSQSSYL